MAEAQTKAQPGTETPQPVRLEDYRPPDYLVDEVELRFAPRAGGEPRCGRASRSGAIRRPRRARGRWCSTARSWS